jgi:hypothetical protein
MRHYLNLMKDSMRGQFYSVYLYLNDPLDAAPFEVDE